MLKLGAEPAITAAEAATRLGCHVETIRRHVRSGRLGCAGRGPNQQLLVYVEELELLAPRQRGRPKILAEDDAWDLLYQKLDLDDVQWGHLEQTIDVPGFDAEFLDYLTFHRLVLEGKSWREAAAAVGIKPKTAAVWLDFDRFEATLDRRIEERYMRIRRGQFDPDPPKQVYPEPRRRGPAPTPRPDISPELEELGWDLIAAAVTDPRALEVIEWAKRYELEIGVPIIVEVARYTELGYSTAQVARLVERSPRRVRELKQELRGMSIESLLVSLHREQEQQAAKVAYLEQELEDWKNAQAWRGFA